MVVFWSIKNGSFIQIKTTKFIPIPYANPELKWNNLLLFWNSSLINKKNRKGKTINPIGNIKNGGNKIEDSKPQIINFTRIFKLKNFFDFQSMMHNKSIKKNIPKSKNYDVSCYFLYSVI